MPLYDLRCDSCKYEWTAKLSYRDAHYNNVSCPECSSAYTRVVWKQMPGIPAERKRPYELLDRPIPDEPQHFGPPKGGWKIRKG